MSSVSSQLDLLSTSPFPAWATSVALLYKGAVRPPAIASAKGSSGLSYQLSQSLALAKPSRASCFTFGAANALGGWIIFDGDHLNGAGFTFAWSTLYIIVNGTSSVKSLFRGRVAPVGLSLLALGNAGIYGKKFFWS